MPFSVTSVPASAVVKETTRKLHEDVEALLLPKLASQTSLTDYAAILHMFYGYFAPLESLVLQHIGPEQLPDVFERRKATLLLHDLQAIGLSTSNIPLCRQLPFIASASQAFGALYVMEGSTLGGRMITKLLLKNKSVPLAENAVSFFSGYGEETGSKWKTFLDVFNQQTDVEQMVNASNETFYYLKGWMQHTLYHE